MRVRHRVVVDGSADPGEVAFENLLSGEEPRPLKSDVAGSDLSCLMYTSGTTGRAKGAMLTHDNHLWNVVNSLSFGRGLRVTDVTVTVAPMFHIGGLGVHTLPLLYVGGRNASCRPSTPRRQSRRWRVSGRPCSSWSRRCGQR